MNELREGNKAHCESFLIWQSRKRPKESRIISDWQITELPADGSGLALWRVGYEWSGCSARSPGIKDSPNDFEEVTW